MTELADGGELAGLSDLILEFAAACAREAIALTAGDLDTPNFSAKTDRLRERVQRRVRRLETLARMGGIEPSDVRAALVGTWRN